MAKINVALDTINSFTGYQQAYTEYIKQASKKSNGLSSYMDALAEHLKWETGRTIDDVQESKTSIVIKDKEIEDLRTSVKQLTQSREELEAAKRKNEHILRRFIYSLIHILNSPGRGYEIPEDSVPICNLVGKTVSLRQETADVNRNLVVSRREENGNGHSCHIGTLIGCVFPDIVKRKENIGPGSGSYYYTLLNLKFYFRQGMCFVLIRNTESENLYTYGPIEELE
jgi:hypothetical protein